MHGFFLTSSKLTIVTHSHTFASGRQRKGYGILHHPVMYSIRIQSINLRRWKIDFNDSQNECRLIPHIPVNMNDQGQGGIVVETSEGATSPRGGFCS